MSWLQKLLPPRIKSTPGVRKTPVPEGLWVKCPSCEATLYRDRPREEPAASARSATTTSAFVRASASSSCSTPEGRFEIGLEVVPVDSLKFKDSKRYPERLEIALEETGETDALVVMQGSDQERAAGARRRSSSISWAARWARSSASASCAACASRTRIGCRSSASRRPAARGCRKACIRCSRWRRPPPCCRS